MKRVMGLEQGELVAEEKMYCFSKKYINEFLKRGFKVIEIIPEDEWFKGDGRIFLIVWNKKCSLPFGTLYDKKLDKKTALKWADGEIDVLQD